MGVFSQALLFFLIEEQFSDLAGTFKEEARNQKVEGTATQNSKVYRRLFCDLGKIFKFSGPVEREKAPSENGASEYIHYGNPATLQITLYFRSYNVTWHSFGLHCYSFRKVI